MLISYTKKQVYIFCLIDNRLQIIDLIWPWGVGFHIRGIDVEGGLAPTNYFYFVWTLWDLDWIIKYLYFDRLKF